MNVTDRTNWSKGMKAYGRFRVHPDKLLVRIWPVKGVIQTGSGVKLWVPPTAQRNESGGRWARVIQIGDRILEKWPGMVASDDIVFCAKYVDNLYGKEGKFRLGGKLVCVTMITEILLIADFESPFERLDFIDRLGLEEKTDGIIS